MDAGWLNVGSLIFGCIAWGLPIIALIQYKKGNLRRGVGASIMSFSACAIALCMQIFYMNHLVSIQDWTALLDTSSAVAVVSCILIVGTILMNGVALTKNTKKTQLQ